MGEKRQSQHDTHVPNHNRVYDDNNPNSDTLSDKKQDRNRRLENKKRDRLDEDLIDVDVFEDDNDELDYLLMRKKKAGKKKRRKDRGSEQKFLGDEVGIRKDVKLRRKGRRAQQEWSADDDWDV